MKTFGCIKPIDKQFYTIGCIVLYKIKQQLYTIDCIKPIAVKWITSDWESPLAKTQSRLTSVEWLQHNIPYILLKEEVNVENSQHSYTNSKNVGLQLGKATGF